MKYRMGKRVLTALVCLTLAGSCTGCSTITEMVDKLGFDTYDYMSEVVHTTYETDSETAVLLADMIRILTPTLVPFDNMNDAISAYRDTVLTYMLESEYARYSGNMALLAKAAEAYPEYQISEIIPAADFEATMYRYFGGSVKISHKDGSRFRYLSKVQAYISLSAITATDDSQVHITSLGETDKTWRVTFTVSQGQTESEPYFVLIIKRDDGTLYFKQLQKQTGNDGIVGDGTTDDTLG